MELRPATPDDAPALALFARNAFHAAFGHLYKPADLAAFFADARSEERYRADIADPAKRIQLAIEDGRIAAYALIVLGEGIAERPAPQPVRPVFLSQLYCARETTGKGIGAALLDWAIAQAREWGADAMQLSVFSENFGAQRFYRRHGFDHVADIDYWVGDHRDDEFLYELRL
ncbi:ribosomal protein S18 acetylase RimI-like enzyme [Altererythrobacter atlanticus]|uniref:Protease synthase and sporulation negative regulatory protein PAI 1 n=1 Tax=Croceibacterium atlanticum TaxID=1267766 RepID=A0A0F7KQ41_9SPHN|nr:GNAT family N-acetyltransferase [Croceibacterium atlanticum]AKH42653.1 Protease synthase and sporulation negative regulatory protein PAI 1 [Croceibacterium atlanticum]MBB5731430.1 ribosomal protein S18 acetylase RimI-like enzyme [Croceibacterium atlanticum]